MKRISTVTSALMALALLSGCNAMDDGMLGWGEGVVGSGTSAKDVRSFTTLRGVHLATIGDLRVETGDKNTLVIEADDNLLKYITTTVNDGVLRIDIEDGISIRTRSQLHYHLTTTSLQLLRTSSSGDIAARDMAGGDVRIGVSSSGDISVRDIDAKKLEIGTSSSGDIRVTSLRAQEMEMHLSSSGDVAIQDGSVERQQVRISSSGDYDAPKLRSQRATVNVSSSGDAHIWAVDKLRASTSSSGSIFFRGNPDVEASRTSSGDIERIP